MLFFKELRILQVVCSIVLAGTSLASPAQDVQSGYFVQAGIVMQSFHYQETDAQGAELDREDGVLRGVEGGIGIINTGYTLLLAGSLHGGTIAYDGQTQIGTPLTTNTDERIVDVSASVKRGIGPGVDSARLMGGVGYREWQRDIHATSHVSGLYEVYRWPYWMLGIEADVFRSGPWTVGFDERLIRPVHPTMEVEVPGYDPVTLLLGAKLGLNFRFPIKYRFAQQQSLVVTPYWQRWTLGHSPRKRLYSNGAPTSARADEPDSETNVFGISATLRFIPEH